MDRRPPAPRRSGPPHRPALPAPGRRRAGGARGGRPQPAPAAPALGRRVRGDLLPPRVRRARSRSRVPAGVQRRDDRLRDPRADPGPDVRAVRRGAPRLRHRGAEAPPHPGDVPRRGDLDAVPLRAERRLRRRRRVDDRRARRRRLDRERVEGLDDRRLVLRLRPVPRADQLGRAQAPGPDRLHRRRPRAGRRAAPHRDDRRHPRVLPGVPDRRPGAGREPGRRRRRRLDRRDAVDVPRAPCDGRRLALRDRGPARERRGAGRARPPRRARRAGPAGSTTRASAT